MFQMWAIKFFKDSAREFLISRLLCQRKCLCQHYADTNFITLNSKDYDWLIGNKSRKICYFDYTGMKSKKYIQ